MKNIFLKPASLLFLNCFCALSFAQTTVPFPTNNAHWCENGSWTDGNCVYEFDNRYTIRTDTIIAGTLYQVISNSIIQTGFVPTQPWLTCGMGNFIYENYALIRSAGNKVFQYDLSNSTEFLLYDFNLQLNDTMLSYPNSILFENKITGIDSVFDGNQYRKRWWLTSLNNNPPTTMDSNYTYVIDGIGSGYGLFGQLIPPFEYISQINCFTESNGLSFSPNGFCNCITLSTNEIAETAIEVYPNPADDYLNIKTSLKNFEAVIYDAVGKEVLVLKLKDTNQIDISNLMSGIYFLKITNGEQTILMKKIFKN